MSESLRRHGIKEFFQTGYRSSRPRSINRVFKKFNNPSHTMKPSDLICSVLDPRHLLQTIFTSIPGHRIVLMTSLATNKCMFWIYGTEMAYALVMYERYDPAYDISRLWIFCQIVIGKDKSVRCETCTMNLHYVTLYSSKALTIF